jgi:hypothetical protein
MPVIDGSGLAAPPSCGGFADVLPSRSYAAGVISLAAVTGELHPRLTCYFNSARVNLVPSPQVSKNGTGIYQQDKRALPCGELFFERAGS